MYEPKLMENESRLNACNNESRLNACNNEDEESIDEMFAALEDDTEFLTRYREERIEQLSAHIKEIKRNTGDSDYGLVNTIDNEGELIRLSTSSDRVVIHFFIGSFNRCKIMDHKLAALAKHHLRTKFLRINAECCPFLVNKIGIKVLPFTIAYVNGVEKCRIVGFEGLGGNQPHDFSLKALERLLKASGVLPTILEDLHVQRAGADSADSDLDI
ncbi:HBR129Wp [Eremothecium sinecaudum]|uniref:HBR129Wp n=1 Tax=Eremothecium sinecaudum TaxID=45286 RepID=A0A125RE00_9SACH|nr:HBR129Wp [Eremothecium sinecaudum]AMD19030.1 HBR129Wp [Eremothecium sinecaudum]